MITERAYAKVNLLLRVRGFIGEYHDLETIMAPIDLYDEVRLEKRDDKKFVVTGLDIENSRTLQACELFQAKYGIKGANIYIERSIPMGSGLGSSSADASATLRGLNRLYELNIPLRELEQLATKLGSDNAYCLYNKAALCYGRGNLLNFLDFDFELQALLIMPNIHISTGAVYDRWRMNYFEFSLDDVLVAIKKQDYRAMNNNLFNDLLGPLQVVHPEIRRALEIAKSFNINLHLSGSGSAFFVLSDNLAELEEIAKRVDSATTTKIIKIVSKFD